LKCRVKKKGANSSAEKYAADGPRGWSDCKRNARSKKESRGPWTTFIRKTQKEKTQGQTFPVDN